MVQVIQVRAVLVACSREDEEGCTALLPLAGKCSLDFWLQTLQSSPRLQPLHDKMLVVGSPAHQQQLQAWAAAVGLPGSCIVTSSSCTGLIQGLAAAVTACPSLADGYVLAANASFVLEPGTSLLSRLVEAAIVRSKDTITCTIPFEGAAMAQLVQVHKEDPAASNGRVSIHAAAEGLADGCCDAILGPVAVLSPSSLCSLDQAAVAAGAAEHAQPCSSMKDLGLLMQLQQQDQGRAVYSIDLPLFFSLDREDFALTDAFLSHYMELQCIATREVQQLAVGIEGAAVAHITGTIDGLMGKLQTFCARHPPSPVRQQLTATVGPRRSTARSPPLSGPGAAGLSAASGASSNSSSNSSSGSSLKHMFAEFAAQYQEQLESEGKAPVSRDYSILPRRFEHPEAWYVQPKKQHPCYATSSNDYGAKQPTGFDMPLLWTGIHGRFTNTFNGGCYRSLGLKTSVERSRVHRELDYL